jgi:hypothetical protein
LRCEVKNKVRTCVSDKFPDGICIPNVTYVVPGNTSTELQLIEKRGMCGRLQRETVHFRAQRQEPLT